MLTLTWLAKRDLVMARAGAGWMRFTLSYAFFASSFSCCEVDTSCS